MKRKPYDPNVDILIGIDPAMVVSGWAVRLPVMVREANYVSGIVDGIENLRHFDPFALLIAPKPARIFVLAEYPKWSGHGAEQVRAAANCWFRYIETNARGRQIITDKVTPQTWQSKLLGVSSGGRGRVKVDPKPVAMEFAKSYAKTTGEAISDGNQADAVCLRSYAWRDLHSETPTLFLTDSQRKAVKNERR
jgi:hypothetical protein